VQRWTSRARRAALGAGIAAALVAASAAPAAWAATDDAQVDAGIFVDRVDRLPDDFAMGVDVSTVVALEESGVVFRDAAGRPADLFDVLADNGVNSVRVRVWNNPHDEPGHGYGGGTVDVDRAVEIGRRATAAGLDVLVDFHYSDFWADPARQLAPKAWAALDDAGTVSALHAFTVDALHRFADAGVDVRMVQIGNETNNAIAGHTRAGRAIDAQFAALVSAGSAAVREVLPQALVAVHFTNPETPGRYAEYAAGLAQYGVDYDVFASSYYPYWHGTLDNLTTVLGQVATTYGKKVMVAETSWARTLEDGDGYPNVIGASGATSQYPVSVQGQAWELRDVIAAVSAVGDAGIGVYYWEPAWLPVGPADQVDANRALWERFGSGWASSAASGYDPLHVGDAYGGSAWDNQSLFAWDGTPLESLRTFAYVRTGAVTAREVVSVEAVALTIVDGAPVALPGAVTVGYNDRTSEQQRVTWSTAVDWIRGPGHYAIPGRTASGLAVTADVVVEAANHVVNGGFELDDMSAWHLTEPAARQETADAAAGGHAVTFWSGWAYRTSASQTLTGVPAGTYVLQATTQGTNSPSTDTRALAARTSTGAWSAPLQFTVWNEFHTATVPGIVVGADGIVEISADFSLSAGAWGVLDDVRLIDAASAGTAQPVDKSSVTQALATAAAVDRARFTQASLAQLDEATSVGEVVVAASRATARDVKDAAKLVLKAVHQLKAVKTKG